MESINIIFVCNVIMAILLGVLVIEEIYTRIKRYKRRKRS